MNAKTIVLSVLFLTFGFIAKAIEIPGGIVYSNGKDAIYYDLETQESKNLTSDLNGAVVKDPFAVSENGKFLIWLQNSKFYLRELPIGTPRAIQVNRAVFKENYAKTRRFSSGKDDIKEDITWQGDIIKNMSLSPDGSRFAFDAIFQEIGWVFTGQNVDSYPFYAKIIDSYNGIFYLSTIYNRDNFSGNIEPAELKFSHPRYGNVVKKPPVLYYKASRQNLPGSSMSNVTEVTGVGLVETGEKIYATNTIKKNAYGLTFQNLQNWEKEKKLAAFIYQIGDQWGPIELKMLDSKTQGEAGDEFRQGVSYYFGPTISKIQEKLKKPREWEIRLSLKSCEGLFWKPDGSLTFLSEGNLYSIDALKIQNGINSSDVISKRKGKSFDFIPVNNVFMAEPELVVQDINGACIYWISNDAFLFLGRDMTVYLWNQGKIENVLYSPISSKFYYCSKSPFTNVVYSDEANVPPAISGKDRVEQSWPTFYKAKGLNIGPIKTDWMYSMDQIYMGNSVNIRLKKGLAKGVRKKKQEVWEYEYTLPEENNLSDIKDPSKYEYRLPPNRADMSNFKGRVEYVKVPSNEIIILKSGNFYVAIKPIELEPKIPLLPMKSWDEEWMTYEWKFWPEIIPSKQIARSDPAIIK